MARRVDARTLVASRLHEGSWLELGAWSDDDGARAAPFDAVEVHLAELWGAAARRDAAAPR